MHKASVFPILSGKLVLILTSTPSKFIGRAVEMRIKTKCSDNKSKKKFKFNKKSK